MSIDGHIHQLFFSFSISLALRKCWPYIQITTGLFWVWYTTWGIRWKRMCTLAVRMMACPSLYNRSTIVAAVQPFSYLLLFKKTNKTNKNTKKHGNHFALSYYLKAAEKPFSSTLIEILVLCWSPYSIFSLTPK